MYNENKNNNIVTTSECNRSKSSITNIKQLFPSRTKDECLMELKKYEDKEIFVIGGGQIYEMLLPYCKYAHVTKINYDYAADTHFPNLDELENWEMIADSDEHTYFDLEFYFHKYENKNPLAF